MTPPLLSSSSTCSLFFPRIRFRMSKRFRWNNTSIMMTSAGRDWPLRVTMAMSAERASSTRCPQRRSEVRNISVLHSSIVNAPITWFTTEQTSPPAITVWAIHTTNTQKQLTHLKTHTFTSYTPNMINKPQTHTEHKGHTMMFDTEAAGVLRSIHVVCVMMSHLNSSPHHTF